MTRTTNSKPKRMRSTPARNGLILAMVLVALLVVTLLGAALANAFVAHRQFARHREQQQQAFWIAESALQHAAYRLATEPDYEGQTWEVTAEKLGSHHAGVAVIHIETGPERRQGYRIVVDASYPLNSKTQTVQHRELIVQRSNE
ncbi:MAG: hypothetical protein KDB05_02180 [Planctomycetales bacterium]|nr:hypothetical protein [Planctomycetales bacterium]